MEAGPSNRKGLCTVDGFQFVLVHRNRVLATSKLILDTFNKWGIKKTVALLVPRALVEKKLGCTFSGLWR